MYSHFDDSIERVSTLDYLNEEDYTRLFIIGNGFDIQMGLKTSYDNFFEHITKVEGYEEYKNYIVYFYRNYRSVVNPNPKRFDYSMVKNVNVHDSTIENNDKNKFPFKNNYFINLFILMYSMNPSGVGNPINWFNIEELILNSLEGCSVLEIYSSILKQNDSLKPNEILNSFISNSKKNNGEIYNMAFLMKFIYFEDSKCNYNSGIDNCSMKISVDFIKSINHKTLLHDLYELEKWFREFLNEKLDEWERNVEVAGEHQVINYFDELVKICAFKIVNGRNEHQDLEKTFFLNFNYTNTIDRVLELQGLNKEQLKIEVVYLHGNDYPIFGIDLLVLQEKFKEENGIINHVDLEASKKSIFTKTYRKMLAIEDVNYTLPVGIEEIYFYGHSLTKMDYSYFQSIFDFYNIYSSEVTLKFRTINSLRENTIQSIYNLIMTYGETMTNENHGRNLIHKLILENRLKIEVID